MTPTKEIFVSSNVDLAKILCRLSQETKASVAVIDMLGKISGTPRRLVVSTTNTATPKIWAKLGAQLLTEDPSIVAMN